ncbi:hypothetical protein CC86DRAFT_368601 [Ophiobolus disseminans]|uniref:Uncharacterized protein n=1 Tax=Ophiobolus disseminans TaxID=1469910 RepID=A0A6A7A6I3_9PLEO|nr:hypothetical protein CC86DRAFT_368601 [Ophiobolus disseminans]
MAVGKYKPLTLTPINFSLTEGTSIPAPLETPPETPRPPTPGEGPLSSHPTPISGAFPQHEAANGRAPEEQLHDARTSDAASSTLSPASPTQRRPSSVRKFLGLRSLPSNDSLRSERPGSPATINSQAPTLTRRKSSSWFGKKKNTVGTVQEGVETARPISSNTRTVSQPAPQPTKKQGPPPPALPELKSFGVSADSLSMGADDMFKNIK